MYTEQPLSPQPFGKITQTTHDEHQKLYAGYVKNANLILEHGGEFAKDMDKYTYELNELQRRFSFEWAGIRNHEIYFKLLEGGATPITTGGAFEHAIKEWCGSLENFIEHFKRIALTRGIGWAMLYYDRKTDKLMSARVDEQHIGQLADCSIVLALDMWEHAYVADYQPSGKKQYVDDFFTSLNWSAVEALYTAAKGTS